MVDNSKDAAIRARAYQLWIESGYADGYQDAHWRQAEREIAEKAQSGQPGPDEGRHVPAADTPESGRHVDGMSRHPSVLDPAPSRSGGSSER